jgi:DNA phosphorothioation-associated putative methyltransferase
MIGKRVAGDLYLHKTSLAFALQEDQELVQELAQNLVKEERDWNVVRIGNENVAFLTYQDFAEAAFPELRKSVRFDLLDGRKSLRDFSKQSNPPILHRKELLLHPDHPGREDFSKLTESLDRLGVFYEPHKIGFKEQWRVRLASHGISINGHKITKQSETTGITVERYRTALARYQLSQPVQLLIRQGVLSNGDTLFDYGCGRGDDVETLNAGGIKAAGWDPHFAPENPKIKSTVVNIGFVLNVIENPDERRQALSRAWNLADKALSVAVMSPSAASIENAKPYKDGFLTSRNTFQKYYTQDQLKSYISDVIGVEPVAVAPGIFFAFKDEIALQEYQINRYARGIRSTANLSGQRSRRKPKPSIDRLEKVTPALEALGAEIMELGRPIHSDEMPPELSEALQVNRVAFNTAQHYCLEKLCPQEELDKVAAQRKEDLLLYFALELFSRHKPYRQLPKRLQQDLKQFWGNYANAQIAARELLFSIGNEAKVREAVEDAADEGLGYLLPDHQFQFHQSQLGNLQAILRCYVACGSILFGDVEQADMIKIHMNTGKLTLLLYENFEDLLPVLRQRIKIDMRSQQVHIFDYDDENRQYLYMKSLYLPEESVGYVKQAEFDRQLSKITNFDFSGYGPSAQEFDLFIRNI